MQRILTTDDLRETRRHGVPDFPLEYYLDDTRDFYNSQVGWHWHNEFELLLVSEGTVMFHIGRHVFALEAGEAIFINSKVLHQFTAEDYGIMPNIVFAPEFIAPAWTAIYQKYVAPVEKSTLEYLVLRKGHGWQGRVLELVGALFSHLESGSVNELRVRNLLSEAWLVMVEQIGSLPGENKHGGDADFAHNSVMVMIQYIQEHYMENIGLADVAAATNISKNTAIRYFDANIGQSPIEYLIRYRITMACKMLKETSDKVSHVAGRVGYENVGYFCRLFRKHVGMSPKEFRTLDMG